MNKQEFCERVKTVKYEDIDSTDWDVINTVYAYHPMISDVKGKDEIAALYKKGGLGILKDMFGTAKDIADNESKIQRNVVALENLKKAQKIEMNELVAAHHLAVQELISANIVCKQNLKVIAEEY